MWAGDPSPMVAVRLFRVRDGKVANILGDVMEASLSWKCPLTADRQRQFHVFAIAGVGAGRPWLKCLMTLATRVLPKRR